ncbi:MAG TPA: hypothetical protein DDY37_04870 [Legionella sp.]|nr:hypothetical protein [Legionella sp.]
MTITVKKLELMEQQPSPNTTDTPTINENYLGLVGGIEVSCLVRLGTLTLTIQELRQLKPGAVLPLSQKTNEPVDILLNNQVIARGDLMSCDDCFAIKITEIAG